MPLARCVARVSRPRIRGFLLVTYPFVSETLNFHADKMRMLKCDGFPLVNRRGSAATSSAPSAPQCPTLPREIIDQIILFVPQDALEPLTRVDVGCKAFVEPLLYRYINFRGWVQLYKAKLERDRVAARAGEDDKSTRFDRIFPVVRTLTKTPKEKWPSAMDPLDLIVFEIPTLKTIRVTGVLGDEQALFTLAKFSNPTTLVLDYTTCEWLIPGYHQVIPHSPASIDKQIQLVHGKEQGLVQDMEGWEFGEQRSTVILFLPQDPAKWATPDDIEAGIKALVNGWNGWFHPVTFVGTEYLGMAGSPANRTIMQVLQKSLDEYIEEWWTDPETEQHPWRQWLTASEGGKAKAVKKDRSLMRWMTLAEYLEHELDDDEIQRKEALGWVRKWEEYGAVACEPIIPPKAAEPPNPDTAGEAPATASGVAVS